MADSWGGSWGDSWGSSWGSSTQDELRGRVIRRGKTKIWTEEELRPLPEQIAVEAAKEDLTGLLNQQSSLRASLADAIKSERNALRISLTKLNREIADAKRRLAARQAEYEKSKVEYERLQVLEARRLEEEEDVRAIVSIIAQLY